jgi:ketosteroid isomerase-like protein
MDQHTIAINLAVVEAHFGNEAAGRVDEAVALYTADIVWEAPSRQLRVQDKEAVAANYRQIFRTIKNVQWHGLDRFATEDQVVDDSVITFEVAAEGFIPLPIGTRGEMRLTHLFHMRDGKIAEEIGIEGPPHAVEGTRGNSAAAHQRRVSPGES